MASGGAPPSTTAAGSAAAADAAGASLAAFSTACTNPREREPPQDQARGVLLGEEGAYLCPQQLCCCSTRCAATSLL
jgi:hypothetical protein